MEEALDLSLDRILNDDDNIYIYIYILNDDYIYIYILNDDDRLQRLLKHFSL